MPFESFESGREYVLGGGYTAYTSYTGNKLQLSSPLQPAVHSNGDLYLDLEQIRRRLTRYIILCSNNVSIFIMEHPVASGLSGKIQDPRSGHDGVL